MPFRHISAEVKHRALWLLKNDYIPADVCDVFGFSHRSLQRWQEIDAVYGSPICPGLHAQGRPRILNVNHIQDLYALVGEAPELFLDEIQEWLGIVHELAISRSALHNNIRDSALTYKALRKAASEADQALRDAWMADAKANWVASQLVFVDESSKDDRTIYRHFGRSVSGMRAVIPAQFIRGIRYSIVAALTVSGYLDTLVVEGSVDGSQFFDFIVEQVVREFPIYHLP